MDRDERETLHVAMILTALFCFLGGFALGATLVDRLNAQAGRTSARDLGGIDGRTD